MALELCALLWEYVEGMTCHGAKYMKLTIKPLADLSQSDRSQADTLACNTYQQCSHCTELNNLNLLIDQLTQALALVHQLLPADSLFVADLRGGLAC